MRRRSLALAAMLIAGLALASPVAGASASSWRATIVGEGLRGGATMLLTGDGRGSVSVTIRSVMPAQPVAISVSIGHCMPGGGSVLSFLTAPASLTGTAAGKAILTRAQVAALNEAISGRRPLAVVAFGPSGTGCGDLVGTPRVGTGRLTGTESGTYTYDIRYPVVSGIDPAIAGLVNTVLRDDAAATVAEFVAVAREAEPELEGAGSIVQTFAVGLSRPSLLSLIEHQAPDFLGQPHGDESFRGFTFDLTTGRQIQLAELFRTGSEYVEALERAAADALEAAGVRPGLARLIVDAGTLDAWRLAPGGIRVTFFGGQCCAVPLTTITVPWSALRSILAPDSPISEILPR